MGLGNGGGEKIGGGNLRGRWRMDFQREGGEETKSVLDSITYLLVDSASIFGFIFCVLFIQFIAIRTEKQ